MTTRKSLRSVTKTLAERQLQHGSFVDQAEISQALSEVMQRTTNYWSITPHMRESLEIIQIKVSRILEGDCNHVDHWHDIAGYATLVERYLLQEQERLQAKPAERA